MQEESIYRVIIIEVYRSLRHGFKPWVQLVNATPSLSYYIINIEYVWEDIPLGTIGAVSKIKNFEHDYILLTNSDILTNLDYENFFLDFFDKK